MSMPGSRVRASFCFAIPFMLGSVRTSFLTRSLTQGIPLLKDNQSVVFFCLLQLVEISLLMSEKNYFHATSAAENLKFA